MRHTSVEDGEQQHCRWSTGTKGGIKKDESGADFPRHVCLACQWYRELQTESMKLGDLAVCAVAPDSGKGWPDAGRTAAHGSPHATPGSLVSFYWNSN